MLSGSSGSSPSGKSLFVATLVDLACVAAATMAAWVGARMARVAGVPLVLSYIVLGAAFGPHALGLVPVGATARLWFVQGAALSVVGFVAAAELFFADIEKPKSVLLNSLKAILACFVVVAPAVAALSAMGFPWLRGLGPSELAAVCVVFAMMSAARAPSVTIAVLAELHAAGPWTSSVFRVVIVSGIAVVALFPLLNGVMAVIVAGKVRVGDLAAITFKLGGTLVLGLVLAGLIRLVFTVRHVLDRAPVSARLSRMWRYRVRVVLRVTAIVLIGLVPAVLNKLLELAHVKNVPLAVDGLLTSLWTGVVVTNWTSKRAQFAFILEEFSQYVFAVFFVFTGAGLDLSVFASTLSLVPLLFGLRMLALFLGHFVTWRSRYSRRFRALLFLGHVGQGGITVSLAAQLPAIYGELGRYMQTACLSVLLLNTLLGPLLLKLGIKLVGEGGKTKPVGRVVLFGTDVRPLLFCAKLLRSHWNVMILDTSRERLEHARIQHGDLFGHAPQGSVIWDVVPPTPQALAAAGITGEDSVVVALPTDDENYAVAKAAVDLGLCKVLVKIIDPANVDRFLELHVLILDMSSALLDFTELTSFTLPPLSAASETSRLLDSRGLQQQQQYGLQQVLRAVKVLDPLEEHYNRTIANLVWPGSPSVSVSGIIRGSDWIVPSAQTRVLPGDRFVLVGDDEALRDIITATTSGSPNTSSSEVSGSGSITDDEDHRARYPLVPPKHHIARQSH
jgi:Trk K+ transport system NAD-binding subunit